mmetsp:Transcript_13938/g.23705  ORF Transcript_13938/g.23705 Transcript_13938/m.23705 type:complete len:227 (-) Transcript_13938:15-695(-)
MPLFMAFFDYLLYRTTLSYYHWVGMICMVICAVCVSLAGLSGAEELISTDQQVQGVGSDLDTREKLPTWIPALFGVLTPVTFAIQGLFVKHLSDEKMKFDPSTLTFSTCQVVCTINLLVGLTYYWRFVEEFDGYLFLTGSLGSILDTAAITAVQTAFALGPAGPVAALASINSIILTVIQAFIKKQFPKALEIIGFIIGFIGATILVLPEQFEKLLKKMVCWGQRN